MVFLPRVPLNRSFIVTRLLTQMKSIYSPRPEGFLGHCSLKHYCVYIRAKWASSNVTFSRDGSNYSLFKKSKFPFGHFMNGRLDLYRFVFVHCSQDPAGNEKCISFLLSQPNLTSL